MAFQTPTPSAEDRRGQRSRAGLCADCRYLQLLRSKTSLFVRCGLSDHHPDFNRYPPLPVLICPGFAPVKFETAGDDSLTPAPDGR